MDKKQILKKTRELRELLDLAMESPNGWMCWEVLEELEVLNLIVNEAMDRIEKELAE